MSVSDHAAELARRILHDHSPRHVIVGLDAQDVDFVVIGRVPEDDNCLVIRIIETEPNTFRYNLEYRKRFGKHPSDSTIRNQTEAEIFAAVRAFLTNANAA